MPTLLFEIGTEELPSWYVTQGRVGLERLAAERLRGAGLSFTHIKGFATPRRLAVLVYDLSETSERREELRRGPAVSAAFTPDGTPSRAVSNYFYSGRFTYI